MHSVAVNTCKQLYFTNFHKLDMWNKAILCDQKFVVLIFSLRKTGDVLYLFPETSKIRLIYYAYWKKEH